MLERIIIIVIAFIFVAIALMTIESIRELGISLLASAGVAGIIIGFAAQKSFGQVFSGIQIAFTQPIRIDDVVVIEGEWGRIEEINITYAVVKIWDQRRLIVPKNTSLTTLFKIGQEQNLKYLNSHVVCLLRSTLRASSRRVGPTC